MAALLILHKQLQDHRASELLNKIRQDNYWYSDPITKSAPGRWREVARAGGLPSSHHHTKERSGQCAQLKRARFLEALYFDIDFDAAQEYLTACDQVSRRQPDPENW